MKVTLTWDAVADAASYTVYRSTTSGQQGASIGSVAVPTLVDASLSAGTKYFYSVTASNVAGTSAPTSQVSVNVPAAPATPANLVAVLGA